MKIKMKIGRLIFIIVTSILFVVFGVISIVRASSIEVIELTSMQLNNDDILTEEPKVSKFNYKINSNVLKCGLSECSNVVDNFERIENSIYTISNITKDVIIENSSNDPEPIAYEEVSMPEPIVYYSNRYDICLTEEDMQMFCTVVSSETGYCEDKIQKAVAHTIINRIVSDQFPNTMYEVVTQRNQYTAIHSYFDGQYRKDLYPGSELWNHTMNLLFEVIEEEDFIKGAVAYYNPYMKGYNDWFEQFTLTYEDEFGRFFVV